MKTDYFLRDYPSDSPRVALSFVTALEGVLSADPETFLKTNVPEIFEAGDQFAVVASSIICPKKVYVWNGADKMVLVAGLDKTAQALNLISGWQEPLGGSVGGTGVSPGFVRAAQTIILDAPSGWPLYSDNFFGIGHSYGGATVEAWSARREADHSSSSWTWSFGAPRVGSRAVSSYLRPQTNIRWFGAFDPVRMVPPHVNEAPLIAMLASGPQSLVCNLQVQSPRGIVLQENGQYGDAETWPSSVLIGDASILAWMIGADCFGSATHSLTWYRDALQNAVLLRTPVVDYANLKTVEQPGFRADLNSTQNNRVAVQMARENSRTPQPVTVVPGDPLRYVARKKGKVWVVLHADEIVAVYPGKRLAKSRARALNKERYLPPA